MWVRDLKSPHYCTKISTKLFGSLKNFTYLCTIVKQLKFKDMTKEMENKSSKPAQKQALRKTNVMRWLDYPEHQPNIGDEIVVCYPSNKELGLLKRELVEWTFKTMNNSANNPNLKFKWLRLPAIP